MENAFDPLALAKNFWSLKQCKNWLFGNIIVHNNNNNKQK